MCIPSGYKSLSTHNEIQFLPNVPFGSNKAPYACNPVPY